MPVHAHAPLFPSLNPVRSARLLLASGLLAMGARGDMQDQQIKWLERRGECEANLDCIAAAYAVRMAELTSIYEGLQRPK